MHRHHILRQHWQLLQQLRELLHCDFPFSFTVGFFKSLLKVWRVLFEQLVEIDDRVVVEQIVLLDLEGRLAGLGLGEGFQEDLTAFAASGSLAGFHYLDLHLVAVVFLFQLAHKVGEDLCFLLAVD